MDINDAINQISEINSHLTRSEVFRGYRPLTVFFIGIAALANCLVLTFFKINDISFVLTVWTVLGSFLFLLITLGIILSAVRSGENFLKHQTIRILIQFVPALAAGAVITWLFLKSPQTAQYLPGVWALFFAVGIFSMKPYLPGTVIIAGLYYLVAGTVLLYASLVMGSLGHIISLWGVGLTFGSGHVITAIILLLSLKEVKS